MSVPEPHDHITYEQKPVEIIKEREKVEMFYDQGYWPILVILREGPLTVREMTEKSNILIEKKVGPELDKKFKDYKVTKEGLEDIFKKLNIFTDAEEKQLRDKKSFSAADIKTCKGKAKRIQTRQRTKIRKNHLSVC